MTAQKTITIPDAAQELGISRETTELSGSENEATERVIDRAGYVRSDNSGREYLISPTVWDREILKGVDRKPVHAALLKDSVLRADSEGKASIVRQRLESALQIKPVTVTPGTPAQPRSTRARA